ncbi:hypothetical protein EC844_107136 [Acinetobacter calcoaceticus]|uniref:Uncharacterized protein n=1 Tax=Acinetobacter calcoaceticus TaxID=471 RepID=A0A4R1XXD2_ACICA|nr:hypothetical protein EC844_107136 [Acinetobacter calcoaceticus]
MKTVKLQLYSGFMTLLMAFIVGLFFYIFVRILSSIEPKYQIEKPPLTVEQYLADRPADMRYLYTTAQAVFREQLPPITTDNFAWAMSKWRTFEFKISSQYISDEIFEKVYLERFIEQGWQLTRSERSLYRLQDKQHNQVYITEVSSNTAQIWSIQFYSNYGNYYSDD